MKSKFFPRGFTLIELLIVITIIGILAVAFLPNILGAPSKARDAQRQTDLQSIQEAFITADFEDQTPYPSGTGCIGDGTAVDFTGYTQYTNGRIPSDPSGGIITYESAPGCGNGRYYYKNDPDGNGKFAFGIYAKVENFGGANTECDDAYAGALVEPTEGTTADDNLCFAILSN